MRRAVAPDFTEQAAVLLALNVSRVERHGLLCELVERAYLRGVHDGYRMAYNAIHPKEVRP